MATIPADSSPPSSGDFHPPDSCEALQKWIVERVSKAVGIPPAQFDLSKSFDDYGLDSLVRVNLSGEFQTRLKRTLAPTLLDEHSTVPALVDFLAGELGLCGSVDGLPGATQYAGGENFGLSDLFTSGMSMSLASRVDRFHGVLQSLVDKDQFLNLRQVMSPAGPEVEVRDRRTGRPRTMVMFGSNNYLGLANHPWVRECVLSAIDQYGVGIGGPPLLNGLLTIHAQLEERLAAYKGAEAALLFSSGYSANVGMLTGLLTPKDTVLFDAYSHASFVDGVRMNSASFASFPHNDVAGLSRILDAHKRTEGSDVFVGVEGVYSMDGDLAPLDEIVRLCKRQNAMVIVDDAHATGVLGEGGRGSSSHFHVEGEVDIVMGTFSKAFGVVGGFVASAKPIVDYLRFFARSYVFSASLPPPIVAAVLAGLDVLEREPDRIDRLRDNVRYAAEGLRRLGFDVDPAAGIITLRTPPDMDFRRAAMLFHQEGLFVNAVEYPAVPKNEQRFRISLMATHEKRHIDRLLTAVAQVWCACSRV